MMSSASIEVPTEVVEIRCVMQGDVSVFIQKIITFNWNANTGWTKSYFRGKLVTEESNTDEFFSIV